MSERVLITGIGSISCFGVGHAALVEALQSGATGVAPIARFDTGACRSHRAALIRDFDPAAFIPPLKLRRIDAVGRLALACARLAFTDAGSVPGASGRDDVGVALGTYTAGLDSLVEYLDGLTTHGPTGVPAILFSNTVSNAPASLAAIEFGLRGPTVTFNQREASSLAALAFAAAAVREERAAAMLTGGADCLEETFFKVHDRFRALSPLPNAGSSGNTIEGARPFDRDRNGFVLGEGGFLLLLESERAAKARGARAHGEILGVGAAATKTARNGWPEDPRGIVRAMRAALSEAKLAPADVGAVIGASNGSPVLDRLEAAAIADVFGAGAVPVASIKGSIGESSAAVAAGIIAGLFSAGAGQLVPTVGCAQPDAALPIRVGDRAQSIEQGTFMVNAVASGGTIYSVVIRAGVPVGS